MHDYGYDFNFPRNYHPGNTANADDYYFCQETFDNYIAIIESCVFHIKGQLQGQNLILNKWQRDIVAALFCLKHKKTHSRRYSEAFIYVPRKNGKSMLCSAFTIAYLILDPEKGKEAVSVASSSDQAALIYKPIRLSLNNSSSPINSKANKNPNNRFKVLASPRKIISENELNTYMPLTADGETNHGLNVSFSVMDEMHTWKQKQGQALYEAVITSGSTRKSPLNIIITTADFARDSMCNAKFIHGRNVASGKVDDPTFLPVLYYLEPEEDWTDPANWAKCNPQFGDSIHPEFYEKEVIKAKTDPTYTNSFKRLYLNIQTQAETKFLDYAHWMECEDKQDLTGEDCYGGLDLAYKSDMCAFVLEFPFQGKYHIVTRLWIPEGHPHIQFYRDKGWIDSGDLIVTEGNGIDFGRVRKDIIDLSRKYQIQEIGFDPRYASELCQYLYNQEGLPMVEVSQSPRILSEPLKDIATSIPDDKFRHDGNKCASWQIGNATAKELDNGLIKLVKPTGKDATLSKVDFVAALSMAHQRMLHNDSGDFNEMLRNQIKSGRSIL